MDTNVYKLSVFVVILVTVEECVGQLVNRAPHFVPGVGDMSKFSLKENTPVGTPIYQLKGIDPENSQLHYSISGQQFTVDRLSGVVTLRQPLDRETQDLIEAIISITDEGVANSEPNTVSLRREIAILDENDNVPTFHNRPYKANVSENAPVGSVIHASSEIRVTDLDEGVNADVTVGCFRDPKSTADDDICDTFDVNTEKIAEGVFVARISLLEQLDFERRSSYILTLRAVDSASTPLSAFASVAIEVLDVQDQPPIFINAPYSATVPENTPEGTSVLTIRAKDGDTGSPRPLRLTIENDYLHYFKLVSEKKSDEAVLVTSDNPLDRENPDIMQNGGIYTFTVKATELINNELPSEFTATQVTIVITDIDDQVPTFNADSFEINVSEDIQNDTPLPGLNMVVVDDDIGANSRYNLTLRNVENSDGVFDVVPKYGEGRTPVAVRVIDSSGLDYDVDDPSRRVIRFEIVASVRDRRIAGSNVTVRLTDANDNSPTFAASVYRLHVAENAPEGHRIETIAARDDDSGRFGEIRYYLRGFGSEKFRTDESAGDLYVAHALDYETQKSYSLTLEAIDGGGRVSSLNIFVEVDDVNDNAPLFESREYLRTVREGATSFEPQLFVHATDADGPSQGGGTVFYSIESTNSISETMNETSVFSVDGRTGEIRIERPVRSMDTPRGQYDLIVRATDAGVPSLHNETRVLIRVGVPGNQRPIFRGNYNPHGVQSFAGTSLMHYRASLRENVPPGTSVVTVQATDPDGIDSYLSYYITGGHKDNFVIDKKSGLVATSPYSNLDLDSNPKLYNIVVHAVDNGLPIHETATSTVFVTIEDVNNKAPMFNITNTTAYVTERAKVGDFVVNVKAYDPDEGATLRYRIVEPIRAKDKTGVALKPNNKYDYKNAFRIDDAGDVVVNDTLNYNSAAVIILTVEARDLAAEIEPDGQVARTEVTIYVQAYSDDNPTFVFDEKSKQRSVMHLTFDVQQQTYRMRIPEEQPIGFKILMLDARDPLTGGAVSRFDVTHSDTDLFTVLRNGEVILTKRLDYEALNETALSLTVSATSDDGKRTSEAKIYIEVEDVNDNAPVFERPSYKTSLRESSRYPEQVLAVKAVDLDSKTENSTGGDTADASDRSSRPVSRFGDIYYSLSGENSNYFVIDPSTGVIRLSPNVTLDRERQSVLRFNVTAADAPNGGPESHKTTVPVIVDVLDVNDNAPAFYSKVYTAVVAENVVVGTTVVNTSASDPDEGVGSEIAYEILDESEVNGLFQIDPRTGEIKTRSKLTGKGRTDPYLLTVRAQDGGGLFTDVPLTLYIGDVSANDGVPTIIKPTLEQIAYVSENSTIGSPVFQIVATDPDDPTLPSGKLTYKLLNDGLDYLAFKIDPENGLLTTKVPLDREKQDLYTLVLVVQDKGTPPQQATRILNVQITDVDDHKPRFVRGPDDEPIVLSIEEEVPVGSVVGHVRAIDEDIGENGAVDYLIISGNEHEWYSIERTEDNEATIRTANRIDRESYSQHLLTIKCFKASERKSQVFRKPYNRLDPSEIQVSVKISDVDDNLPMFEKSNVTIGVRLNVPIDTSLIRLEAVDVDSAALPIRYKILHTDFTPLVDFGDDLNATEVFRIDENTGDLRTGKSLINYVDGVFKLLVRANNSAIEEHHTDIALQIYVIRDRDLLKFVFSKPPADVRKLLSEFEASVQKALDRPNLKLHIYDTQFHTKRDKSLDFSSTSSCFQLVGSRTLSTDDMMDILTEEDLKDRLRSVYDSYHVTNVEHCSLKTVAKAETTVTQLWVLIIACFIGIAAFIASCTLCCMHRRFKTASKHILMQEQSHLAPSVSYMTTLSQPRMYAEPLYSS